MNLLRSNHNILGFHLSTNKVKAYKLYKTFCAAISESSENHLNILKKDKSNNCKKIGQKYMKNGLQ